jgi:hypothetical protein
VSRGKRRVERRTRRRVQRTPRRDTKGLILDTLERLFTPKPYDEGEAVVDALSGRRACRHGIWPHQAAACAVCVAEGAATVCLKLLASTP